MKTSGCTVWVLWGFRRGKWHLDSVSRSRSRAQYDARAMRDAYPRETFMVREIIVRPPKEMP